MKNKYIIRLLEVHLDLISLRSSCAHWITAIFTDSTYHGNGTR